MTVEFNLEYGATEEELDRWRNYDDTANVVVIKDEMQRGIYKELEISIDLSLPAIVSAFQPKSGGTFLYNRLVMLGYRPFAWCVSHRRSLETVYCLPYSLQLYLKGGCTFHSHAYPNPQFLQVLAHANVDKIWIHLRDPAETVVSTYHHFFGDVHGEEDQERIRVDLKEIAGIELERDINAFAVRWVHSVVLWPMKWLAYAQKFPDAVYFTSQKDLTFDAAGLLNGVLRDFGYRGSVIEAVAKAKRTDRFRVGRSKDWRDELQPQTVKYVRDVVDKHLKAYPFYEAIRAS